MDTTSDIPYEIIRSLLPPEMKRALNNIYRQKNLDHYLIENVFPFIGNNDILEYLKKTSSNVAYHIDIMTHIKNDIYNDDDQRDMALARGRTNGYA